MWIIYNEALAAVVASVASICNNHDKSFALDAKMMFHAPPLRTRLATLVKGLIRDTDSTAFRPCLHTEVDFSFASLWTRLV